MSDRQKQVPTTTKALLLEAADVIRRQGLMKDAFCDADGRVCFFGALYVALGEPMVKRECGTYTINPSGANGYRAEVAARLVAQTMGFDKCEHFNSVMSLSSRVVYWNDADSRTAEDVASAMEKAALSIKE